MLRYIICTLTLLLILTAQAQADIFLSAGGGNIQAVKKDLDANTDVNKKDDTGRTALYYAASNGHTEVVRLLLEHNADVNAKDFQGITPLFIAVWNNHPDIVRLLIDNGADINVKITSGGFEGSTPLAKAQRADIAKMLIDKGADVNLKDSADEKPLSFAIRRGHNDVVQILIDSGADINIKDDEGNSLLHTAANWNNLEAIKLLIAKGAISYLKNKNGSTPIIVAEQKDNKEIITYLEEIVPSFKKQPNDQLLSTVKNLHLYPFLTNLGYLPVGKAFDKYFDDVSWNVYVKNRDTMKVGFRGVFENNGRKALFSLGLKISDPSAPTLNIEYANVNRNILSEAALNDLLFAVFLESKK